MLSGQNTRYGVPSEMDIKLLQYGLTSSKWSLDFSNFSVPKWKLYLVWKFLLYVSFIGTHQHPPSRFSFDKTGEYQQQLEKDLEKLLQEDHLESSGSPTWAIEATKIVHHAGKSQLFNKKLLAASKVTGQIIVGIS